VRLCALAGRSRNGGAEACARWPVWDGRRTRAQGPRASDGRRQIPTTLCRQSVVDPFHVKRVRGRTGRVMRPGRHRHRMSEMLAIRKGARTGRGRGPRVPRRGRSRIWAIGAATRKQPLTRRRGRGRRNRARSSIRRSRGSAPNTTSWRMARSSGQARGRARGQIRGRIRGAVVGSAGSSRRGSRPRRCTSMSRPQGAAWDHRGTRRFPVGGSPRGARCWGRHPRRAVRAAPRRRTAGTRPASVRGVGSSGVTLLRPAASPRA